MAVIGTVPVLRHSFRPAPAQERCLHCQNSFRLQPDGFHCPRSIDTGSPSSPFHLRSTRPSSPSPSFPFPSVPEKLLHGEAAVCEYNRSLPVPAETLYLSAYLSFLHHSAFSRVVTVPGQPSVFKWSCASMHLLPHGPGVPHSSDAAAEWRPEPPRSPGLPAPAL